MEYEPVQNPWTSIVRCEPNRRVIASHTNTDDITLNGIDVVIDSASRTSDNRKCMLKYK
jgi:hypothetical protein